MDRQGYRIDSIWTKESEAKLKELVQNYNLRQMKIRWVDVAQELTNHFQEEIKAIVQKTGNKKRQNWSFTNAECRRKYKNKFQKTNTVNSKQITQDNKLKLIQHIIEGKSWSQITSAPQNQFKQFTALDLKNLFRRSIQSYILNLRDITKDDDYFLDLHEPQGLEPKQQKDVPPYKIIVREYFTEPKLLQHYHKMGIDIFLFFQQLKNRKLWRKANKEECELDFCLEERVRAQEIANLKALYALIRKEAKAYDKDKRWFIHEDLIKISAAASSKEEIVESTKRPISDLIGKKDINSNNQMEIEDDHGSKSPHSSTQSPYSSSSLPSTQPENHLNFQIMEKANSLNLSKETAFRKQKEQREDEQNQIQYQKQPQNLDERDAIKQQVMKELQQEQFIGLRTQSCQKDAMDQQNDAINQQDYANVLRLEDEICDGFDYLRNAH